MPPPTATAPPSPTETRSRWYWPTLLAVTFALCAPILSVKYPPLVDYPNHLALAYIAHHYHDSALFQQTYHLRYAPVPDLATDMIVALLLNWVSPLLAGKVFLILTVVVFALGCHVLGTAIHGRPTFLAVPCAFFVYCSMFFWGFLNFVFGLGLFLFCVGLWIKWNNRWTFLRIVALTLLSCSAYLAHLTSYGFVVVAVVVMTGCNVYTKRTSARNAALGMVPLLPPLALFAIYMRHGGHLGSVSWNLHSKLKGALSVVLTYDRVVDVLIVGGAFVLIAILVRRRRQVGVFGASFVAALVFLLLYLILPDAVLMGSWVDVRFIPPALSLLVLSLRIDIPQRPAAALFMACLVLSSVRIISIWHTWRQLDVKIETLVEELTSLPEGARIYPATSFHDESKTEVGLHHAALYATVFRSAFVPSLMAIGSQEIVLFRRPVEVREPGAPGWADVLSDYDFVYSDVLPPTALRDLEHCCTPVLDEPGLRLWRVQRAEASEPGFGN